MTSYKNPPPLSDAISNDCWRTEMDIWRRRTELAKEKQTLAVTLSLSVNYRETAIALPLESLETADRVTNLLKETTDSAYEAYRKLSVQETYQCPSSLLNLKSAIPS